VHADIDKEIYIEQLISFEKEAYIKDDYKLINNISFAGNKRLKTDNISSSNKSITNNKLVCKLNKALYGLKQSPRLWYKYLLDACKEHGFIILPFDEAIFIHEEYKIIIICHVDDLIITGPNETKLNNIITKLSNKLKLEYIGLINQFLRMEINLDYKNKTILIH
jgi:Reverse transcriptase (RNA-dependent DNA polymerase)